MILSIEFIGLAFKIQSSCHFVFTCLFKYSDEILRKSAVRLQISELPRKQCALNN